MHYTRFVCRYVMVMSFINWLESHVEHKIGEICKWYNHYFSNLVRNGSSSLVYYNNNTEGSETQVWYILQSVFPFFCVCVLV